MKIVFNFLVKNHNRGTNYYTSILASLHQKNTSILASKLYRLYIFLYN